MSHLLKARIQDFQTRDLLKYLDVIFGNQSPFPSQVTQEPLFINGLQIGYYVSNLRETIIKLL